MSSILGIDLGISSVGFALVDFNEKKIIALGSRIFDTAEEPKTGASLALPRRLARGRRRIVQRKSARLKNIVRLLEENGFTGTTKMIRDLTGHPPTTNPWTLRKEGLGRLLTDEEFSRVLYHIAKRRGFQSNRKEKIELGREEQEKKEDKSKKEKKAMLASINRLNENLAASGSPTIGAYLALQPKQRNNPHAYDRTVERQWLKEEVNELFEKQRKYGQTKATEALREKFEEIAFTQLPIQSSLWMVGRCQFEPEQLRAPQHSFTAERFVALSKLSALRIMTMGSALGRQLTNEEKKKLHDLSMAQKSVTFNRARKELALTDNQRFNLAVYRKTGDEDTWEKIRKKAEEKDLISLKGYHEIKKAVESVDQTAWMELVPDIPRLDQIAYALSFFHDENEIKPELAKVGLPEEIEKALIEKVDFSKTIDLSLKALYKIVPHMEEGQNYADACVAAGYHHSKKARGVGNRLPPVPSTRNPVVDRSLGQARKVINAIIKRHGVPDRIHVEFSRDLGRTRDERNKIQRENEKFAKTKENTKAEAEELLESKTDGEFLTRYRLWKEQGGYCIYTGEEIKPDTLKDPLATQIDHALPRSRSWDNSYSNKVLCMTWANQRKGNRTPYEWLTSEGGKEKWEKFEIFVRDTKGLGYQKRRKLLMKDFDETAANEFRERNLNDTRYMARKLKEHIEANIKPKEENKQFVMAMNGQMTAMLRGMWGLEKSRQTDTHHALDAAVISAATNSMVKAINEWSRYGTKGERRSGKEMPPPWEGFREDLLAKLGKVFVSRQPVKKTTGKAHDDTILSGRVAGDKTIYVKKVGVEKLKIKDLANLVDVEIRDGKAEGRNARLYETLKNRLQTHGDDPEKAFREPIRMPTNDPAKPGPEIRSVRLVTNDKSLLPVRGGYAGQDSMARVDVYRKGGKYCLVPVYAHHAARKEPTLRVCASNKPMEEWPLLDNTCQLIMKVSKNDYLVIDKGSEKVEGYFVGMDINTASFTLKPHHNLDQKNIRSIGIATAKSITKYVVNVFGERFQVKKGY